MNVEENMNVDAENVAEEEQDEGNTSLKDDQDSDNPVEERAYDIVDEEHVIDEVEVNMEGFRFSVGTKMLT